MTATAPVSERPVVKASFNGVQDGMGVVADFEIWTLDADIPGFKAGFTLDRKTIEAAGYALPERTS